MIIDYRVTNKRVYSSNANLNSEKSLTQLVHLDEAPNIKLSEYTYIATVCESLQNVESSLRKMS